MIDPLEQAFLGKVREFPFSLALLTEPDLERCVDAISSGNLRYSWALGPIIGESFVRKWLSQDWETGENLKELLVELSYEPMLKKFSESRRFREGLDYIKDRPKFDDNDEHRPWHYFHQRLLDFINCDGIALVVSGNDSEGKKCIPLPYMIEEREDCGVCDREGKKILNSDWAQILKTVSGELQFDGGIEILSSFDDSSPKLEGGSFLLSLAFANWRKQGRFNLHPLELGITGEVDKNGCLQIVPDSDAKAQAAHMHGASLFVAPSPRLSDDKLAVPEKWVDVQGLSLPEVAEAVQKAVDELWTQRAGKLPLYASEDRPAIRFKLIYDLELPNWNGEKPDCFEFVKPGGKTRHLSRLRPATLCKVFENNLFLQNNEDGEPFPMILELKKNFLRSLDTIRRLSEDPQSRWLKLDSIDLIPYKGRIGIPRAELGFVFHSIKGVELDFKSYRKWISQRQFGDEPLFRNNENLREGETSSSVTLSQVIQVIKTALSKNEPFDLDRAMSLKSNVEEDPKVVQFLLSRTECGAYWAKLTKRPDFGKAFRLVSALSRPSESEPKTNAFSWKMPEAKLTKHSVHGRALTVWSHSDDEFNRDMKPEIVTRAYHFLWVLAKLCIQCDLDPKDVGDIFHDKVKSRKDFFNKCLESFEPCE